MQISPFSCTRPKPEHIGGALSLVPKTKDELDHLIAEDIYTLDSSRALYLCEIVQNGSAQRCLIGCCDVQVLRELIDEAQSDGADNKAGTGNGASDEAADECYHTIQNLGAHIEPVVLAHDANIALDIILSATENAVPLYNISNASGTQIVVWRISRQDTIDALSATYASLNMNIAAGRASALAALKTAQESVSLQGATSTNTRFVNPAHSVLCALVSRNSCEYPKLPLGMFIHKIR